VKNSLALLAAVFLVAATSPIGSSLGAFRHQPAAIRVGEVAHYVKSNLDGSKPCGVAIFVAAPDELEVAKIERGLGDAAWVRAHFDWKLFTADRIKAAVVLLDGTVEERAELTLETAVRTVRFRFGDTAGSAAWKWEPFHIYNFDFTSLNFAWRHLADPTKPFTIGVMDPTFANDADPFVYRGEARIEYVRDERIGGKTCRLYRISGPGIGGKTGSIWQDPKSGWLQRVEIPFPDNPAWNTFRLELQRVEKMTADEWKRFMRSALAEANPKE